MCVVRIGELADLAGVTVRAVRHYHHRGVLPEPARRANGYREYEVEHLVTLVRLGHLTRSGLSLAQAGEVVADGEATAEEVLDEIDEALRRQIAALTAQRDRLAEARAGHHLGLPRLAAALVTKPEDIPLSTLFAHLHTDEERAERMAETLHDRRSWSCRTASTRSTSTPTPRRSRRCSRRRTSWWRHSPSTCPRRPSSRPGSSSTWPSAA